jgi:hypothetical protein
MLMAYFFFCSNVSTSVDIMVAMNLLTRLKLCARKDVWKLMAWMQLSGVSMFSLILDHQLILLFTLEL